MATEPMNQHGSEHVPDDYDDLDLDWDDLDPDGLRNAPVPDVAELTNEALKILVTQGQAHFGLAALELTKRAATDTEAARIVGRLASLPVVQNERFHRISMAWTIIAELLGSDTAETRAAAYEAFESLDPAEQHEVLEWLRLPDIRG